MFAVPLVVLDLLALLHIALPDRLGMLVALFHAASGWVHVWSLPLVLLAAWRRDRWWLGVPSLGMFVWLMLPGSGQSSGEPELVVATHNSLAWNGDPAAQGDRWLEEDVDVLVVQELGFGLADRFDAPDLQARFPHRHVRPSNYPIGIGVYSRHPLDRVDFELGDVWVRAEVAGTVVYGVHARSPFSVERSRIRTEQLAELAQDVAREIGPVVVVGDLNTGPSSPSFRHLLEAGGLTDAVAACATGWSATWSQGPLPTVLRLDHVLLKQATCTEAEVLPRIASDHAPIRVGVRL